MGPFLISDNDFYTSDARRTDCNGTYIVIGFSFSFYFSLSFSFSFSFFFLFFCISFSFPSSSPSSPSLSSSAPPSPSLFLDAFLSFPLSSFHFFAVCPFPCFIFSSPLTHSCFLHYLLFLPPPPPPPPLHISSSPPSLPLLPPRLDPLGDCDCSDSFILLKAPVFPPPSSNGPLFLSSFLLFLLVFPPLLFLSSFLRFSPLPFGFTL